jgi:hypothetical protein
MKTMLRSGFAVALSLAAILAGPASRAQEKQKAAKIKASAI